MQRSLFSLRDTNSKQMSSHKADSHDAHEANSRASPKNNHAPMHAQHDGKQRKRHRDQQHLEQHERQQEQEQEQRQQQQQQQQQSRATEQQQARARTTKNIAMRLPTGREQGDDATLSEDDKTEPNDETGKQTTPRTRWTDTTLQLHTQSLTRFLTHLQCARQVPDGRLRHAREAKGDG